MISLQAAAPSTMTQDSSVVQDSDAYAHIGGVTLLPTDQELSALTLDVKAATWTGASEASRSEGVGLIFVVDHANSVQALVFAQGAVRILRQDFKTALHSTC